MYSIRIHPDISRYDQCIIKLRGFLAKYAGSYYFAREVASREHLQGWAIIAGSKVSNINVNLRYALGDLVPKGNSGGSIKEARDPLGLQEYCCKGQDADTMPDTVIYSGLEIDNAWIKQKHDDWWEKHIARGKVAKTERLSLRAALDEFAKTQRVDTDLRRRLAVKYCELCVEFDKPIDTYYARKVVNLVQARLDPDAVLMLADEIVFKM